MVTNLQGKHYVTNSQGHGYDKHHIASQMPNQFLVKFYDSSVQLNRNGVSTYILGDVVTLRDRFGLAFCHRDHFTNRLCEWHLENQHYRHLNSNRENRKPKHLQVDKLKGVDK